MKKNFLSFLLVLMINSAVFADNGFKISHGFFFGLSGTSIAIFLLDEALDLKGNLIDEAADSGLLTGELGYSVDFNAGFFGVRPEVLLSYYKFRVFDIENVSYFMAQFGVEPYLDLDGLVLGGGVGVFHGYLYDEVFNVNMPGGRLYPGFSSWVMAGLRDESTEWNIRVRIHKFFRSETVSHNLTDFVLVLRFVLWF